MFRAYINLPAELTELDVALLAQGFEDLEPSAQLAMREDDNHRGIWRAEWILEIKPDPKDLETRLQIQASLHQLDIGETSASLWTVEAIDTSTDWLKQCYQTFPPFSVGPFFIHGSHYDDPIPQGQMPLKIDAATAFGSGEHGTTKGCLMAMLDMKGAGQCPWNVLDLGTGSGILAIAAWKLWKTPILATDIDPESVRVTEHHAALNGVNLGGSCLSTEVGDGFNAPLITKKAPFDLIIANILAAPLRDMASDISKVTDDNGYVLLSGMLNEQAQSVLDIYQPLGFTLRRRYDIDEWSSLALQKIS